MNAPLWFLTNLMGGSGELINVRCLPPKGSDSMAPINKFFGPRALEKGARYCIEMAQDFDVYAGVLTREWPDGKANAVTGARFLFVDIDRGSGTTRRCLDMLQGLPKPSMVILSGSGGLHVYWPLREPFELNTTEDRVAYKSLLKRLCAKLNGNWEIQAEGSHADTSKCDPAAILRVPGTFNHKHNPPRLVRAVEVKHKAYRWEQWDEFLPRAPKSNPAPGKGGMKVGVSADVDDAIRAHLEKWSAQPLAEGARHNDLTSKANWLGREKRFSYKEILSWLQIKAQNCSGSRIPDRELENIARYAVKGA